MRGLLYCIVFVALCFPSYSLSPYLGRALLHADRLVQCSYDSSTGVFPSEELWQSGNTLETLSSLMLATNSNKWFNLIQNTYSKTPAIVDVCFDDHQWWLLGWVRAYELTKNTAYVQRAAIIFDYIVENAWTSQCNGGVIWCPVGKPYKNSITNELFLSSAMSLHPYTSVLNRPADFYLNWAKKEWAWFSASGLTNGQGLINDGLTDQCQNNWGVTWTYNQGVLLSGLAKLTSATGDQTYLQAAAKVVQAVFDRLTTNNILIEPCSNCDGDQLLFKGIFVRHLGYAASSLAPLLPNLNRFFLNNTNSLLNNALCQDGSFGLLWQGPCQSESTATESSALDLLTSAGVSATDQPSNWLPLGLGNCADDQNQAMPNCYHSLVSEDECRSVASRDPKAVAYDVEITCQGETFCRVRTLGGASSCPSGWGWSDGPATTVSTANGEDLTLCVLKAQ